ncbi:unnamed protein product [Cladocopium goreaui]|uniref:Uncharacterized protein n=1 Tax=Cladocopium goreaui TaxID=2562237 RepID=A0A9P1BL49_9DINO|nr:unnamed protein product [Cladocopium goreaui]
MVAWLPARTAEEGSPADQARALRLDILESQLKDLKARIQPLEEDLLRRQARKEEEDKSAARTRVPREDYRDRSRRSDRRTRSAGRAEVPVKEEQRNPEEGPGRSRERDDLEVDYGRDSEREPSPLEEEVQEEEEGADDWSRLQDTPGYYQDDWNWSSWDWGYWDTWQPNYYPKGKGKKGTGKGKGKEKSKGKNEKGKRKPKVAPWRKEPEFKGTTQVTQSTRREAKPIAQSQERWRPKQNKGSPR